MQEKPVFLFAFANDSSHSLQLDEEWRQAEKALQAGEDAGRLIFNLTPGASLEDIWDKFNRFHNQIAIFHYGGHSGSQGLDLTNAVLKGTNLATLIGQEQHLKLVFLNGCSNAGQVETLIEKGAPAVIATSAPIHDRRAVRLSKQFYSALSSGRTINEAFSIAAAFVNNTEADVLVQYRGLGLRDQEKQLPWGLYVKDKTVLEWKIPAAASTEDTPTDTGDMSVNNYGAVGKQVNVKKMEGDINM